MITSTQTRNDRVEQELLVVRGEISRTDTKSSILLASVAIVAGPLAEHATDLMHQPWPIAVIAVVAAVAAGVATWLLLDVVLPRLMTGGKSNFLHYASCDRDHEKLRRLLSTDADPESELVRLSQIAVAKYERLALAGKLLKLSGLLFAATTALVIAL
ncbi:Pycsar system effector family protein [Streptomyces sp. NPDC002476]|uniref:Pycsar system effector family protein n=1 Tax=Streptomyces sp. NPDC002476 TaxID=3364648 RepID=UPI0036C1DD4E